MIKPLALLSLMLVSAGSFAADSPESLAAGYAKQAGVAVSALSADRGEALYRTEHPGRDGKSVSCASCHTNNPRQAGRTRVGKRIEPMSPSANRQRFTDAAKVEKWFRRNCRDVLQRECSAQEKGDFVTWLIGSAANCAACHRQAERGMFEENDVRIPK